VTVKAADREKIAAAAEKYVKAGKLIAAIVEYEKLLAGTAQDVSISNIIGDLHLRHGDDDKAVRIFTANVKALEQQGAVAQALAIAKKINKIRPHDFENIIRLGDLYGGLGFVSEARAEYLRAAKELEGRKDKGPLLALYEKLARIDRTDLAVRLRLARMYLKKSQLERAIAEMNEVADLLFVRNEYGEAEKIIREALTVQGDNARLLANLVRVLVSAGKRGEAIAQMEENISRHGDRPELLGLLANLHLEAGHDAPAAEIYRKILVADPNAAEARAKLGWLKIRKGRLDEAYEVYEPLVLALLRKNKEDKAVGLLGLIVMTGTMHLPSLEKLATIFRISGRRPELEIVDRILLAEYRRLERGDDRARVVKELIELAPFDPEVEREYKIFHWEANVFAAESPLPRGWKVELPSEPAGPAVLSSDEREVIQLNLAKADQYLAQGFIRNARRVVDNLLLLYPDSPPVLEKSEELKTAKAPQGPDQVELLLGQMAAEAAASAEAEESAAGALRAPAEGKMTAAQLFDGLEIIPFVPPVEEGAGSEYLDLGDKIEEEVEAIETAFYRQVKDRTVLIEQDLADIVQQFRRQVESRVAETNLDSRYALGQAFLEQGLVEEAIEEFKRASADPEREADCYGLIGQGYVKKKNWAEAEHWLERAVQKASPATNARFALTYDLASVAETMNKNEKALALFREVLAWNPRFREVAKRSKILEKLVSAR
jgi:tetratricopeptide (TPR) repeat protein